MFTSESVSLFRGIVSKFHLQTLFTWTAETTNNAFEIYRNGRYLFSTKIWNLETIPWIIRALIKIIQYLLWFVLIVVSNQWVDHTPQWCTHSYRRQLQFGGGVTLEQCKQLCRGCAAIEYWSGKTKVCYECLDHTKRTSYTHTKDNGYPPHVYIRQWTLPSIYIIRAAKKIVAEPWRAMKGGINK